MLSEPLKETQGAWLSGIAVEVAGASPRWTTASSGTDTPELLGGGKCAPTGEGGHVYGARSLFRIQKVIITASPPAHKLRQRHQGRDAKLLETRKSKWFENLPGHTQVLLLLPEVLA